MTIRRGFLRRTATAVTLSAAAVDTRPMINGSREIFFSLTANVEARASLHVADVCGRIFSTHFFSVPRRCLSSSLPVSLLRVL